MASPSQGASKSNTDLALSICASTCPFWKRSPSATCHSMIGRLGLGGALGGQVQRQSKQRFIHRGFFHELTDGRRDALGGRPAAHLQFRGERHRDVGGGQQSRPASQRPKALPRGQRNDAVAQPLRLARLLHHQQPARLADRLEDRAPDRAVAAPAGSRPRPIGRSAPRPATAWCTIAPKATSVSVAAFHVAPRPPHRRQVAVEVDVAAAAPVEQLVLEDQARVRVVEAGHQGLEGLLRRGRIEQLQPGEARPEPLELAGMEGPHRQPAAAGQAQQQRRRAAAAEIPAPGVQAQSAWPPRWRNRRTGIRRSAARRSATPPGRTRPWPTRPAACRSPAPARSGRSAPCTS